MCCFSKPLQAWERDLGSEKAQKLREWLTRLPDCQLRWSQAPQPCCLPASWGSEKVSSAIHIPNRWKKPAAHSFTTFHLHPPTNYCHESNTTPVSLNHHLQVIGVPSTSLPGKKGKLRPEEHHEHHAKAIQLSRDFWSAEMGWVQHSTRTNPKRWGSTDTRSCPSAFFNSIFL